MIYVMEVIMVVVLMRVLDVSERASQNKTVCSLHVTRFKLNLWHLLMGDSEINIHRLES